LVFEDGEVERDRKYRMEKPFVLLGNLAIAYFQVEEYRPGIARSDVNIRNFR
jgi:hypothetical protein